MESVRHLVVGAGISGLAFAAFSKEKDVIVLEADSEIGGYCKTIRKDGFVWDYSGHFFHFKHPDIEAWLRQRMPKQRILTVEKLSFISYAGKWVDFPFQKNIHQLPTPEFIDCLYDLYFAREGGGEQPSGGAGGGRGQSAPAASNFKEMLFARFGRSIAEKFLIPYNEKLYACDLATLDVDAMGRFFPHANLTDIVRNMKAANNASYNSTFTYPEGGAIEYVKALASETRQDRIALGARLLSIDLRTRTARTSRREIRFDRLVSSAPLPRLFEACGLGDGGGAFSWNKVLVFNLGFDRKGPRGVHWLYVPNPERSFYRVGFYDNIFDTDRMSLYVELGYPTGTSVNVDAARARVLEDLVKEGIVDGHRLIAEHSVVMDPAYVHITRDSNELRERSKRVLEAHGVFSIGRYGGWTYCSIEDNIVEARALAKTLDGEI
jgi:protoporphyrinogen oxidase